MDDDKLARPTPLGRVSARTSERVDAMSDQARAELARNIAERKGAVHDGSSRRVLTPPSKGGRSAAEEEEVAAAVLRLTTELHRTERRLYRLERTFAHGRYQTGSASPPTGRHARLLSRASQLERELRSLR